MLQIGFYALIGLGLALFIYIQLSALYNSLVNSDGNGNGQGVQEGIVFDAENMPSVQDEALHELMKQRISEE